MNIIGLIVGLCVVLLLFWAIRQLLAAFGVGEPISTVVMVIFVVIVVLWLLSFIGGINLGSLGSTHLGR
jgi:hypothetical protein